MTIVKAPLFISDLSLLTTELPRVTTIWTLPSGMYELPTMRSVVPVSFTSCAEAEEARPITNIAIINRIRTISLHLDETFVLPGIPNLLFRRRVKRKEEHDKAH